MNKKLIAILTLVMFALTLLPMGAFAASVNTVTGSINTYSGLTSQVMGSLRISGDDVEGNILPGVFTVTLSSGLKWQDGYDASINAASATAATLRLANGTPVPAASANLVATRSTTGVLTVAINETIAGTLNDNAVVITIPNYTTITSVGTGDITATILDSTAGVTGGTYTIGRFTTASATAKALNTATKGDGVNAFGVIRLTETSAAALAGTVKFTLPTGMDWDFATPTVVAGDVTITPLVAGDYGSRTLEVVFAAGTEKSIVDIATRVDVDSSKAKLGDITVDISGGNVESTTVTIGKYGEYSASVTASEAKTIYAGKDEQEIGKIIVKEGLAGSIFQNRSIKFTLPSGVTFSSPSTLTMTQVGGSSLGFTPVTISSYADEVTFTPGSMTTGGTAATYELKDVELRVAADYVGDVVVKVSGTAGVTGEVLVAKVEKPVAIESDGKATLKLGVQGQPIGDIFVIENVREALEDNGTLLLRLPAGASWSKLPTVEVVEGNLDIDTVKRDGRDLTITIDNESSTPSKIKISDVAVSLDRTVAEGDLKVTVSGNAAVTTDFANRNNVASVKIATVTTPVGENVVQPVVMTVGSTVYTIDGVEMTMDVAPYIKDGRTYFPVRYVAQALGITADNVVWDGAQRTVTIFRANRIVQVTIGSTTMLVNGVPLTMDAAPEITAERTMLPIRFVAQGLGVNVNWDAATQTVTLN